MVVGGQRHAPAALPPGKTRCQYWVELRAGLDGCEKSHPRRDSIPGPSSRSQLIYRLSYPVYAEGGGEGGREVCFKSFTDVITL